MSRSNVWLLATKLNAMEAQCNICAKVIKFCGTSTNVRRHLQWQHSRAYENIERDTREEDDDISDDDEFGVSRSREPKRRRKDRGITRYLTATSTTGNQSQNDTNSSALVTTSNSNEQEQIVRVTVVPDAEEEGSYEMHFAEVEEVDPPSCVTAPSEASTSSSVHHTSQSTGTTSVPSKSHVAQTSTLKPRSHSPSRNSKIQTITNCFEKLQQYKRGGDMDTKITEALTYFVIKNCLPFSMVDTDGFRVFMKVACPHYQIPCATTVTNAIDEKYDALFMLKKKKLSSVKYFSLTVDAWTETHSVSSVLGVTAHYIDDKGHPQSVILGSMEMSERHYAEVLVGYIQKILGKWSIKVEQITAVTTDNGANIVAAVNKLVGEPRRISCLAHTLNLISTAGFKEAKVDEIVKAIKAIVTWFHTSSIAAYERKKVEELCLLQSCPTRWNSTYYMLKKFLELKSTVSDILLAHPNAPPMITGDAVAVIEDLIPILRLFDEMTKDCSTEKGVSISRVIPIVDYMRTKLDTMVLLSSEGKEFLNIVDQEWKKRFRDIESSYTLSISTLLDPRYKKVHFQNAFKCSEAVSRLTSLMNGLQNTSTRDAENISGVENNQQLSELDSFTASKSQSAAVIRPCEITAYFQSPNADVTTDPLQYWFINRHEYPQLYELAKRYLCIQGSSTPCERLFSIAGLIRSCRRNRITMERLEKLLFLKSLPYEEWEF